MFKKSEQADKFLDFLNYRHKNVKFTIEKEQDQKLPFLDVIIIKTSNKRIIANYKKSLDTDLLTNFLSFISTRYFISIGLVKTLVDIAYTKSATRGLEKTKSILQRNRFCLS